MIPITAAVVGGSSFGISGDDIHLIGDDYTGDWPFAGIEYTVSVCVVEDDAVNSALRVNRRRN